MSTDPTPTDASSPPTSSPPPVPPDALPPGRSVPVALLLLAMPIIASMISRTVMSFIDFVMVSTLGTEAQAAIMPAGVLLFTIMAMGMGVLMMVNTFVSQALGRGLHADCSAYAWQGLYVALAIGLLVLPAWGVVDELFAAVGHAPAVQRMEVDYVRVGLIGMGPALAAVALSNFFNGIHRPMVGFWAAIIGNLFNVLANYMLIFGNLGAPRLGIAGAAWGTAAASVVQVAVLLPWMLRPALDRLYHSRRTWRISFKRISRIVWYGLPAGVQFSIEIAAFTVFTLLLVGQFGTEQLAAHNICFKLLEISFMPTIGLGAAVTAAVGKAIGQRDPALARRVVRWAVAFAGLYMAAVAVLYLGLRFELPDLLSDDPVVIGWAAKLLVLCAVFQVFDALGIIHAHALRGAGDNHWQAVVAGVSVIGIMLGGGYAIVAWRPDWGSVGPWLAATAYIITVGLAVTYRWQTGAWQRFELLDAAE